MLHDYWGTMIDAGITSVWEEWDPSVRLPVNAHPPQIGPPDTWGTLSLIQPAGVGPARWLLREIVGIVPELPGYQRVRVEPHTVGLAWAKGTVATPAGPLHASWKDTPVRFELTIETPDAVKNLSAAVQTGHAYQMDGQAVKPQAIRQGHAIFELKQGRHVLAVDK